MSLQACLNFSSSRASILHFVFLHCLARLLDWIPLDRSPMKQTWPVFCLTVAITTTYSIQLQLLQAGKSLHPFHKACSKSDRYIGTRGFPACLSWLRVRGHLWVVYSWQWSYRVVLVMFSPTFACCGELVSPAQHGPHT